MTRLRESITRIPLPYFLLLVLSLPPQPMHHCQEIERLVGHRHIPEDTTLAFLERLENHGLTRKINPRRGKGKGLGHAATGVMQYRSKGAHLARELPCRIQKRCALLGGQIEPVAFRIMQAENGYSRDTLRNRTYNLRPKTIACDHGNSNEKVEYFHDHDASWL